MKLGDYFPDMKDWTPAHNPEQANPQVPTPEVQSSPYLRAPLPLPMQYTGDTVKQYNRPGLSSFRTSPIPPSGYPGINSASTGVVTKILEGQAGAAGVPGVPGTPGTGTGTGNMTFRGQWSSITAYAVNDVVLDNISSYVAVAANSNSEPDSGSTSWNLLGKNFKFRGQWLATTAPSTAVHVQSGQVGGSTGPTSVVFGSNNTAGNTIVVFVTAGHNFASGNPDPGYGFSITDTQGNIYTQVGAASAFNAANGWADTAVYIAANIKAGPNTVTSTVVGGSPSPPGTTGIVAAEYAGNPTVTPLTYESQNSISGGVITSISTTVATGQPNQVVLIFSGTTVNSGAETVTPAGFTGRQAELYDKTIPTASSVNYSLNYSGAASGGIIFGLALTNVGGSGYFPFDTVIYQGSTYVCIKAALSSQVPTNTTYWALLSQGTGGVNVLATNYTATASDDGQLISNSTASTFTVKLPAASPYLGWWTAFQNSGTGTIIVNPNGLNLDASASNVTLSQNQGILVFTDGVNYFTERGFGTITSLPSIFNVNATTGAATLANEAANTVFAGPTSGGAATPTFRSLVLADIPLGPAPFNRKVISTTTYSTLSSDMGSALDVQTTSATTITLQTSYLTPAFVQATAASTVPASATLAKAYTSNNTLGNMLLCATRVYNSGTLPTYTVTDNNGNTWIKAPAGFFSHATSGVDLWYALNCNAGPNTVTITVSNPNNCHPNMVISEYSGIATVSALDTQSSAQSGANSTTPNSGNITTAQTKEVLAGFCENESLDGLSNTPDAGWTARANASGNLFYCDQIVSATGTYAYSSVLSSSVAWGAYIAGFKAAVVGQPFSGFIQNNGTAIVTINTTVGLINGAASINLFPGQGVTIATDGSNFTAITWEPGVVARVDLTAQGAAITATTLYAVPTGKAGTYHISWSAKVTRVATTSSTLAGAAGFQITYTDADDSVVVTPLAKPNAVATANTTGTQLSGVEIANAKAGTNIQYQIDYTSVGATTMQYNLHIKAEYLGS